MADNQKPIAESTEKKTEGAESTQSPTVSVPSAPSVPSVITKLIEQIEKLSVLELSALVHALEEKFGVTAAPTAITGTPAAVAPAGAAEAVAEQTTFNVILQDSGANKISVIKAVREIVPTLGLKEAKDLVDSPPKQVLEGVNKETAQEAKTKLEAAGAKIELK